MLKQQGLEKVLDTTGLYCPEPVMLLHKAVRQLAAEECIFVTATDPSTRRDIPKFCEFLGHELVAAGSEEGVYTYHIRKKIRE